MTAISTINTITMGTTASSYWPRAPIRISITISQTSSARHWNTRLMMVITLMMVRPPVLMGAPLLLTAEAKVIQMPTAIRIAGS